MFNLIGSKPQSNVRYKVYLTKIAKYRQLMDYIIEQVNSKKKIHLVAHFDQTYSELVQLLTKAGIDYDEQIGRDGSLLLLSKSWEIKNRSQLPDGDHFLVSAEIHPMAVREENLKSIHKNDMIVFCALDNPFFELFGGDRIRSMMGKLGLKENESIEHPMVSKAIVNAQKKMDKKAVNEKPAYSIREWMNLNTKG